MGTAPLFFHVFARINMLFPASISLQPGSSCACSRWLWSSISSACWWGQTGGGAGSVGVTMVLIEWAVVTWLSKNSLVWSSCLSSPEHVEHNLPRHSRGPAPDAWLCLQVHHGVAASPAERVHITVWDQTKCLTACVLDGVHTQSL